MFYSTGINVLSYSVWEIAVIFLLTKHCKFILVTRSGCVLAGIWGDNRSVPISGWCFNNRAYEPLWRWPKDTALALQMKYHFTESVEHTKTDMFTL